MLRDGCEDKDEDEEGGWKKDRCMSLNGPGSSGDQPRGCCEGSGTVI